MKKLIIPIITPYLNGIFDRQSMERLIDVVDNHVDFYAPCLSSGEGGNLKGKKWEEVIECVNSNTKKPVYAGILNKDVEIYEYIDKANKIGCTGVVIVLKPNERETTEKNIEYCNKNNLEIIFYNAEGNPVLDVNYINKVCSHKKVVGLKDSSMDKDFINKLVKTKDDSWDLYQGMEDLIKDSTGVDGYFISLANVEPEFCANLKSNKEINVNKIKNFINKYNLKDDNWYAYLKKELENRDIISSSEPVNID